MAGRHSQAYDINTSGQVVGLSYTSGNGAQHAFLFSGGVVIDLNDLIPANSGWALTRATGINDSGQIVGHGRLNNQNRAFLYTPGIGGSTIIDLGTLGGTDAWAEDINASGQVVGFSYVTNNVRYHAFLFSAGSMTDLGTLGGSYSQATALNDAGQVTGWAETSSGRQRAFLFSSGTMTDIGTLGGDYSHPSGGINAAGQVAGYASLPNNNSHHAFLFSNGAMTDLGTLGGTYSFAQSLNDAGVVTGWSTSTNNQQQLAFQYSAGTMSDLNALVSACGDRTLYEGIDVNNIGQFTGSGSRSGTDFGFVISPGSPASVLPTTLSVRAATGIYNTTAELYAMLSAEACGISGTDLDFSLPGLPVVSVTTDAYGIASISTSLQGLNAGVYPAGVQAQFAGIANYAASSDTADLTVLRSDGNVTWVSPGAIAYGTPLGPVQLNATADAPGTFTYAPPSGTVLPGGTHGLTVTFAADDSVNYVSPIVRSVAITVSGAQPPFGSTDLGTLGGDFSQATALNDAGQVTGLAYTSANQSQHAFLFSNGTTTDLGTFGGTNSYPTGGINSSGQVAGDAYTTFDNSRRAFLFSNGTLINLGTLGGSHSGATDLNDAGQVTGLAHTTNNWAQHAFLYSNGTMTDLGSLGGIFSNSYPSAGINASGQVAGYWYTHTSNNHYHAFLYTNGAMADLGTLGGDYSQATALNDAGQVTGWANTSANELQRAFLYTNGTMHEIGTFGGAHSYPSGGINSSGQVAGYAHLPGNASHAFRYTNGTLTDLGTLGGSYSQARDINDAGDVVGESQTANGENHAFLYRNGIMLGLGTLGGNYSTATAINSAGDVTGASYTANGDLHAFLFRGGVMTDLGTLGGTYSNPTAGINASGQVAGFAYVTNNTTYHAFLVTPTAFTTSLSVAPATGTYAGTTTLSATLTSNGTPLSARNVTFLINGTSVGTAATDANGVATLNGASLAAASAGDVSDGVRATFAGEQDYLASTATAALSVAKAIQTIAFGALANKTFGDADFALSATASSALPVTFMSVSGPCTVAGNIVHLTGGGECTIRASQGGDINYNPASDVDRGFTITGGPQTITFGALVNRTFGDADFTVSATATSGLPVTFTSLTSSCTLAGNAVHITGAGSCTIRASQGGDGTYDPAPDVDRSFTIAKGDQTIGFAALQNRTFGDPDFALSGTTSSGLAATFSAVSGPCAVTGNTVHISGAGSCTVRASQAGDDNYNAAPDIDRAFTVGKANQAIVLSLPPPSSAVFNTTFNTAGAGGGSGNPVLITAGGACSLASGGTGTASVHMDSGTGTCTVSFGQTGDTNYNDAIPVVGTTSAQKASQVITMTVDAPAAAAYGSGFVVAATGGGSVNPVTFTTPANDGCSDVGPSFTVTSGVLACQVHMNQAGNLNYSPAAQLTQVVSVIGYAIEGFLAPIDMSTPTTTVWNRANAGQSIPTKWRLTLDGVPVSSTTSFVNLLSYAVNCTTGAATVEDAIEEYSSGTSGLQYNGNGQFQFNWKTPIQYKNACRVMYVSFRDGSVSKLASFKFK